MHDVRQEGLVEAEHQQAVEVHEHPRRHVMRECLVRVEQAQVAVAAARADDVTTDVDTVAIANTAAIVDVANTVTAVAAVISAATRKARAKIGPKLPERLCTRRVSTSRTLPERH